MNNAALFAAAARLMSETPEVDEVHSSTLRFQHCRQCGYVRSPESPLCPECLSEESDWLEDSGAGTIWSWCIYYRAYDDAFKEVVPYNVALVELDSGPRLISNVLNTNELRIGQRVVVVPREVAPDRFLLYFELADAVA
jgi:hypothetical protein